VVSAVTARCAARRTRRSGHGIRVAPTDRWFIAVPVPDHVERARFRLAVDRGLPRGLGQRPLAIGQLVEGDLDLGEDVVKRSSDRRKLASSERLAVRELLAAGGQRRLGAKASDLVHAPLERSARLHCASAQLGHEGGYSSESILAP
jgi:hypothetical protein